MEVDSEQLICEVRKYPCIYDRSDPGHSDRFVKAEAWKQIQASLVGDGYEELGNEERNNVGIAVNKKWKALKDAFWRSIKTCEERSENKGVKTKKYVYYDQLRFLLQSTRKRRAFSHNKDHNHKEESGPSGDEEIEGIEIKAEEAATVRPGIIFPSPMKGGKRSVDCLDDCDIRDPLEIINASSTTSEDVCSATQNADKLFLLSLLPDMQALSPKQKFTFKIKVLHLLHDLQ